MLYPADLIKEVVENLGATITFTQVDVVTDGQKCYTSNTMWLYTGNTVSVGGNYFKVHSFLINEWVILTDNDEGLLSYKSYGLTAPTFKHGKLKETKIEISKDPDQYEYYPLCWLFELSPRGGSTDVDTKFESTGSVRLFFMNIASYSDFTTADHYTNVINPLSNLVALFLKRLKAHKRTGLITTNTNLPHARFSYDTGDVDSQGNNVLTEELSGIELDLNIPINLDFNCIKRA